MEHVYWDSDCCLKWLKKEDNYELCKGTLSKASKDELRISISTYTLVEVMYLTTNSKIDKEKSKEVIEDFFNRKYIIPIVFDIPIAKLAREIFFDYKISTKDAIHVASAIFDGIPTLNTFDKELLNNNGKIGNPPLKIIKPDIPYQESLSIGTEENK